MSRLPYVLSVAGFLLILLAWIWPDVGPTSLVWTEEKAQEHARSAAELHHLAHEHIHASASHRTAARDDHPKHGPADPEALEAARNRYATSKQQLDSAMALHAAGIGLLRWSGVLAIMAGGVSWLLLRRHVRGL